MSATATEQEHRCSCGRTFAHEISLKRHRWVTGHAEAEAGGAPVAAAAPALAPAPIAVVAAPIDAEETYRQAVAVLIQKRTEFEAAAQRQRRNEVCKALVTEFLLWIQTGLLALLGVFQNAGRSTVSACGTLASWTLKLAVVLAVAGGLIFSGMGVGRLIAIQADAQPGITSHVANAR